LLGLAQAEVQAEVILGHEAGAARDFVYLRMLAGDDADARANGAAVGFCAYALDFEPVVFRAAIIAQERGRLVHVDNGDVDVASLSKSPKAVPLLLCGCMRAGPLAELMSMKRLGRDFCTRSFFV